MFRNNIQVELWELSVLHCSQLGLSIIGYRLSAIIGAIKMIINFFHWPNIGNLCWDNTV